VLIVSGKGESLFEKSGHRTNGGSWGLVTNPWCCMVCSSLAFIFISQVRNMIMFLLLLFFEISSSFPQLKSKFYTMESEINVPSAEKKE